MQEKKIMCVPVIEYVCPTIFFSPEQNALKLYAILNFTSIL